MRVYTPASRYTRLYIRYYSKNTGERVSLAEHKSRSLCLLEKKDYVLFLSLPFLPCILATHSFDLFFVFQILVECRFWDGRFRRLSIHSLACQCFKLELFGSGYRPLSLRKCPPIEPEERDYRLPVDFKESRKASGKASATSPHTSDQVRLNSQKGAFISQLVTEIVP